MERDQVERLIQEVSQALMETSVETQALLDRSMALLQILQGYFTLYPDLRPPDNEWEDAVDAIRAVEQRVERLAKEPRLRGQAAVASVMERDPDREWTVGDVVQALDERGWLPKSKTPDAPVRTALERLAQRGDVTKVKTLDGGVSYLWVLRIDEEEDALS